MKKIAKFLSLTAAVVALGAVWASCDSIWNSGDEGTLTVLLTDAPFPADLVAEANVTIDSLVAHAKDSDDFITLSSDQQVFNLLDLRNGVTASLASLEIPTGEYNQLRLIVNNGGTSVILNDGTSAQLTIPSGETSGIKLNIKPALQIGAGIESELLLDFDVSKSFKAPSSGQGDTIKFIFKPVVRVVNNTAAGSVEGQVTDANGDKVIGAQVSALLDTVISHTFTDSTGAYALIGLLADTYTLSATAAGYDTVSFSDIEITAGKQINQNFQLIAQ